MRPPPIQLDAAAGLPIWPELAAEYPALAQRYGWNPHGLTCYAEECRRALLTAERRLLELCGLASDQAGVVWCATGTEAANLALRGFPWPSEEAVLALDAGAHPAMGATALSHARHPRREFLVQPDGTVAPTDLLAEAALAALSLVNNETGVVWNGDRRVFPQDCRILLDCCQAFGKHSLPVAACDLMILSSRKLGGPATGAALVYRKSLKINPIITGGGQQGGIRSGTLDTAAILLFVKAAELACRAREENLQKVAGLNRRLRDGLARLGQGAWPVFSPESASPYICYFAIPGRQGAIIARTLAEQYGILVGTGSACAAESDETSHVLAAMGVPKELARSAIRISFCNRSTYNDIERFLSVLPQVLSDY